MAAAPRRRKLIGQRRRVEDEGDDEGRPEALELDDDSLTEGSVISDDHDGADDSDTSNIDEVSPTSPNARKSANGSAKGAGHRAARAAAAQGDGKKSVSDTELTLHGLSIADRPDSDSAQEAPVVDEATVSSPKSPSAPVIVSSSSNTARPQQGNRRRQEHEDYKRRRDEDPAFVPNRGSFFMHDHRHPGPAANGFRPFGRGRGRGGGRGGVGGPYSPANQLHHHPADPTTNSQWTHDMHETVADVIPRRLRQPPQEEGPPNGSGFIPTCEPSATPINRTLSTEKHIGNAQVRVILPETTTPKVFPGIPVKQYTKLPDHRPPLRRDKPVRISLPNHPPRYIFPAPDRSFTFIPRALRPNQQRLRGRPRSSWGSVSGFSRRTSLFGSYYGGSVYSPSVALSRRSSIVLHDRDGVFSPTGSIISRPALQNDNRPVVRLPPAPQTFVPAVGVEEPVGPSGFVVPGQETTSIGDIPQPQSYPLPQRPNFQENFSPSIPMHQPRPQKNISVADIESPTMTQHAPAFQQAFHQQVPPQMANGYQDSHAGRPSFPTHVSTGTPLSQIPERAIHAAPFQPNAYGQPAFYGQQPYQPQPQQAYYYPHGYSGPSMPASAVTAPPFIPQGQTGMAGSYTPQNQVVQPAAPPNTNLVAQEVNGMVYYYDASQLPAVNPYQPYPASQPYQPSVMGMGGMVTPSPDGFYYPQPAPGMVYYSQ
ncbi:CASC3/Barentsz eIF4AIII binding domain-containing protein [Trichoderma austrokoningii]